MSAFINWLPVPPKDWQEQLKATDKETDIDLAVERLWSLSRYALDNLQLNSLHRRLRSKIGTQYSSLKSFSSLRIALLSSSTIEHLIPAIEIAAFRRRILLQIYLAPFGQYRQDILNSQSELYTFKPDVVLFALDAAAVPPPLELMASAEQVEERIRGQIENWRSLWDLLTQKGFTVIHQNIVAPNRMVLGHLDASIPGTPQYWYASLNHALLTSANKAGILLFDMERLASQIGKEQWLDDPMWHHAKQPFSPHWALFYAEHLARLLAGIRGLSKKCLILDLDNTLWGGVIGDDGLDKIEVGQGTGVGEAFLAFQLYARQLKERGVILAVCSKNTEAIAQQPFKDHPDMVLRLEDFAIFVANWEDKASNLRQIAEQLRLGLDSFVFFDDNPAERDLIRQTLPMVEVPEVPEDPALYVSCLSNAGYFEAITFTRDDAQRSAQYSANRMRESVPTSAQDLQSFLKSLQMKMTVAPFDNVSRPRVAQLINKSNQFNLTTRRYTEPQVELMEHDPNLLTFQVRLEDIYGDNGLISVIILKPMEGKEIPSGSWLFDTWLMSCRVLGRQVEQEVLNVIVSQAKRRAATHLWGEYIPTAKNALVRDHFEKLGFTRESSVSDPTKPKTVWKLSLDSYKPISTFIQSTYIERTLQNA
jgi:FkbH-like protein